MAEVIADVAVDWLKIKAGDTFILRLKEYSHELDFEWFARHWQVVNYVPAPPRLKAGDKVRMAAGMVDGIVLCIDGGSAWVRWTDDLGCTYRGVHPADRLERVA